ncbi:MAG: TonB-dependent receptor [Tannerella sp.]|jgi:TonB-linked SusC/RagA family outer membrane protein|nr:TonB-dependent receptor [Tannerella sp.]
MNNKLFTRHFVKKNAKGEVLSFSRTKKNSLSHVLFISVYFLFLLAPFLSAQTTSLSLQIKGSYEQVFNEIERKTGYKFVYNTQEVDLQRQVSISETEKDLSLILDEIFRTTDIAYRISNKHIALFKRVIKNISGIVSDSFGDPVAGANIVVSGTMNGVITDIDGTFSLMVEEGDVLRISYIGYVTQEITADSQETLRIILVEDRMLLDEVVVIGYGMVRKKDLTGAIAQVKTERFATQQSTNVLDFLNGTVAGFNSNTGTAASGSSSMEIRGPASLSANNSPLIVLDGVIFNGSINDINPRDVETIDILKDASSAAVYGSRSAAGVVIINTKRGRGDKMNIGFSAQMGVADYANKLKPNDAEGYLLRRQDFQRRINPSRPDAYYDHPDHLPEGVSIDTWQQYDASYAADPLNTWMDRLSLREIEQKNYRAGNTYDWLDATTSPGLRQNYDVNISGGIGRTKYYWSLGYTDNQGYLKGDEYKIIRTRMNADTQVASFLTVGINAQFSNKDLSNEAISLGNVISQSPFGQPYDDDGVMKWYPHDDSGIAVNPFLINKYRDKFNMIQNLFANIYADLQLPFGFSYKFSFINRYDWEKNYYFDPSTIPSGNKVGGIGQRINRSLYEWQVDHILSWKKRFGMHDFYATLLYNAEKKQVWRDEANNQSFSPSEALGFHQLEAGGSPTISNDDTYSTGMALMGRVNYTLLDRYLLTLSIRRDGYSAFGINNPYATFPSCAIAWNISEEPFFNVDGRGNLKIRASYGWNGNRDIGIYAALSKLGTTKYLSDGSYVSGVYSNSLANSGLKWERTASFNLGVDFAAFNGRLSGTLDYYDMKTNDLLLTRSLPTIIGYSSVMSNMGELENKGFEMTLNSRNIEDEILKWNSTFTFSLNRNKIRHLYGEIENILDADGNVIGTKEADDVNNGWFIGQAIDRIWDYKFLGIYQVGDEKEAESFGKAPGDIKLLDVDENGVSTQEDKVFQGYTKPRFRLGLRNDLVFPGNFCLSFFLRGDLGFYGKNSMLTHTDHVEDRRNTYATEYWTPGNPINNATRLNTVNTPAFTIYQSRSFVRLQDLSLSYDLPEKIIGKFKFSGCKVYISSRNLVTFTKWSGWDPESGNTPMPRIFTFGMDITL